ncbi:MAG: phosphatase PAP2 family protein [Bacteroidota bacterium]
MYETDLATYYFINRTTANPVFDILMPFVTGKLFYFVYAVLIGLLLWFGKKRAFICVGLLVITVAASDSVNSRVIKELVGRVRPCSALKDARLLTGCGGGKSFPSTHATNNFAAAVLIGYFFKKTWPYGVGIAAMVAYSRVYVGVHYPADVLGGALVGVCFALFVIQFYRLGVWWVGKRRLLKAGNIV